MVNCAIGSSANDLIAAFQVNDIQQGFAGLCPAIIFNDLWGHGFGKSNAGYVGCDLYFRMAPERVVCGQGFDVKYIQTGAGQLA